MFSSDHNVSSLKELLSETKEYVELQADYARVDLTGRLTKLFSAIILFAVLLLLALIVVLALTCGLAFWLAPHMGGLTATFAIIAGIYFIVMVWIFACRRKIITLRVSRFIGKILLSKDISLSKKTSDNTNK